jgi:integrase
MNLRLVTPWKRPNSVNYWFRLVVPPRYRQVVGVSEIKRSLNTSDIGEARRACAVRQQEWLERFERIEAEMQRAETAQAATVVDCFLDAQAVRLGGMDAAVRHELEGLALAEVAQIDEADLLANGSPERISPLAGADVQQLADEIGNDIRLRRTMLSTTAACVLPGHETLDRAAGDDADALAWSAVEEAFAHAGIELADQDPRYRTAARHLLARLRNHVLPDMVPLRRIFPTPSALRPSNAGQGEGPMRQPASAASPEPAAPSLDPIMRSGLRKRIMPEAVNVRTLSEVHEHWASKQPLSATKLCDEWRVSIRRFVELIGDLDVRQITGDMIRDFRDSMGELPSRAPRELTALPLLEQIDRARERGLKKLSGATVAKLVSGLRVTLDHACDPLRLISSNPAAGVKVKGAKSDVDARMPFSPEDLSLIFADPLMTADPIGESSTTFWLILLAVLTGMRIEEMGKLRPGNVRQENGIWYIAVERDTRRRRDAEAAEGKASKQAKTVSSYRHIALHWLAIEAGFLDYVAVQRQRGEAWLFPDLTADKYGARTKEISRTIIRRFRRLGITDSEKVFHSFRHSMKRACRGTGMMEEMSDLLTGHAPDRVGRKYGAGAALNVLRDAINLVDYETIDWDQVISAAHCWHSGLGPDISKR